MKEKTNFRKRIICLLIIILLLSSVFMVYITNADETTRTYKVEQITSSSQINSNNYYKYILVYDNGDGRSYALASSRGSSSSNYAISRNNYVSVGVANGILTEHDTENILWRFSKSNKTVLDDEDYPVIQSAVKIYSSNDRKDLRISSSSSEGGHCYIRFTENGHGFMFEEAGNNTFYLHETNCDDPDNDYITFGSYFCKGNADNAVPFKIYKVIENYNYTSSRFLTSEETAQIEDVSVSKTVSQYENYEETAIAEVKLSTQGTDYDKTCDIVLILDDSTSVYNTISDDSDITRAMIIRDDAHTFAEKLLEINPENRICVIKFGSDITNENAVDSLGFSNNISDIEEMIGGDKEVVSNGTNYSVAFRKANEVLETHSDPNHGKVVIFLSDGMPSIYNDIRYKVWSSTDDATGIAYNWIDYVTNHPLQEAELMKATGTTIYTIGSLEDDNSMNNSDGYIIPAETTKTILSNIANGVTNFYDFDKIDTELEEIFERIAKDFNYYPTNAIVNDVLTSDINLLTKNVGSYIPEIVFKRGDVEIEKITFNEDGTEAYSSLNPDTNIMTNGKFEGMYISYDGNKIKWEIGDLYKYLYTLEFPIYLNNTVDLYGEGNNRPTGDYSVSDTTQLSYTDVTGDDVSKDFEPAQLPWTNPTDDSSMNEDIPPEEPQEPEVVPNAKTGDNTLYIAAGILLAALGINIYKKKYTKFGRKNGTIIY